MEMSPQSKTTSSAKFWLEKHVGANNHLTRPPSSTRKEPPPDDNKNPEDFPVPDVPDSPSVVNSIVATVPVQTTTIAFPIYAQPITDVSCVVLMNDSQRAFFQYEKEHKGLGFAYIVKKAFGVTAKADSLGREEIAFHLDLCSLCVNLTRSQLQSVGTVIENIVQYYTTSILQRAIDIDELISQTQLRLQLSDIDGLSTQQIKILKDCYESLVLQPVVQRPTHRGIFKETKPATTYAEIDKCYLRGNNAVYRSLPIPTVHLTENASHAYIHLPQVVASFLASGVCDLSVPSPSEFADSSVVKSYYTSKVARDVYGNCSDIALLEMGNDKKGQCFSIHIKDWADDAQKNNVRSNSTSYNIRTVTFMKHGDNGDVRYYSYIISISLKGRDHDEVERIFNEDLRTLSKPNLFYSGYHKQTFWAITTLVAGVRDRPARGETFHVGNHGHMFGKRFRYAAFHDKRQPLMPCEVCHASRLLRLSNTLYVPKLTTSTCDVCADLDYESPLLAVTAEYISKSATKPDEASSTIKYPTSLVPGSPDPPMERPVSGGNVLVSPTKVTFQLLISVCEVAFFNYHYLVYIRDCRKRARSTMERNEIGKAVGWTMKELKTYVKSAGANEYICKRLIAFSNSNINSHPTELLGRLCTEILPATWQRLGCSLSHQLDAVFHLVFHGISMDVWEIFLSIIGSLKIGGNLSLKSTFKKVLSSLLPSLHSLHLLDLPILPFAKGNNGTDFSHAGWVGSNKLAFCMIMPFIVSHVRYFFRTEAGRQLSNDEEQRIRHIQMALYSFYCSNVILLQPSTTPTQASQVGDYIKVFLYEITESQKSYISKPENLSYLTTGNFLSLLNLEENVSMYGPLRYFWDGLDEKNVQKVKRAWPHVNMSTTRWLAALLENVTGEQHLNLLWKNDSSSIDYTGTKRILDNIHIINSKDVASHMEMNAPFSVLYDPEKNKFNLIIRTGGQRSGKLFTREVEVKKKAFGTIGSCQYYRYRLQMAEVSCGDDPTFSFFVNKKPTVFLPFQYLESDTVMSKKQIATIISLDDHKVFVDGHFVVPSIAAGEVEGHENIDEERFCPDDDGMVAV